MAVVSGPLLSFGASGQIAKTQVYSTWKGRPYVRRLVTPSNPRSTEQTKTRMSFAWLSGVWKIAPAELRAPWTKFSSGLVMTDRNAWIKANNGLLRTQTDLTGLVLSPGAAGGLTVTPVLTGGAGQITIALTAPNPLPAGWTVVAAVGAAILDQNPQIDTNYQIDTGTDLTAPYSIVLSGLAAGDWQAGGWFVYQRSASLTDLAYGSSVVNIVTVT